MCDKIAPGFCQILYNYPESREGEAAVFTAEFVTALTCVFAATFVAPVTVHLVSVDVITHLNHLLLIYT
jgi:hypothetical protein